MAEGRKKLQSGVVGNVGGLGDSTKTNDIAWLLATQAQPPDEDGKYQDPVTGAHFRHEDVFLRLLCLQQQQNALLDESDGAAALDQPDICDPALLTDSLDLVRDEVLQLEQSEQKAANYKTQDYVPPPESSKKPKEPVKLRLDLLKRGVGEQNQATSGSARTSKAPNLRVAAHNGLESKADGKASLTTQRQDLRVPQNEPTKLLRPQLKIQLHAKQRPDSQEHRVQNIAASPRGAAARGPQSTQKPALKVPTKPPQGKPNGPTRSLGPGPLFASV